MHDAAMRRRIAALLAISGAALATAYFAADDPILLGSDGDDSLAVANTGNSLDQVAVRGGGDRDYVEGAA